MIVLRSRRYVGSRLRLLTGSCPCLHSPLAKRFTLAGPASGAVNPHIFSLQKILVSFFWGTCSCPFGQLLNRFFLLFRGVVVFFLFFASVVWSSSLFAVSPETVRLNNKGVEFYESEQFHEAYKKFTEGLGTEPFDPYLQSNLGHTFIRNEEKEKALAAFKAAKILADKSGDLEAKYNTTLNLATMKAGMGDVDGAILGFQECLDLKPGDQLARENIEKMWQSQQGEGKGGKDKDKKKSKDQDQKDGEGEQENKQKDPNEGDQSEEPKKKKKPKPFDSKELTKDDVRKILEELKNQEQKIRADVYEGQGKDRPRDKDW